MITAALSISLLILAAAPAGSIVGPGVVGRIVNPSKHAAQTPIDGRIDNPSSETAHRAADELIFRGDFSPNGDRNHNGWPDDWRRRVGQGYPRYVTMSLVADADAPVGHALRVHLNGAAATAYSPAIAVSPAQIYTLTVAVRTEKVRHDQAFVSLRFLDADEKLVSEQLSDRVAGDTPWRTLRLGPVAIDDPRVRFAVVGLHTQPGEPADLAGSVSFAEVRLSRQPRLRVTTNRPFNVFILDEPATITCHASGLPSDSSGRPVRLSLELTPHADEPFRHVPLIQKWELPPGTDKTHAPGLTWSPRLPGAGHYRLRARLLMEAADQPIASPAQDGRHYVGRIANPSEPSRLLAEHESSVAVLPQIAHTPARGPGGFGWSLPRISETIPPMQLAELADRLGVSVVKLPVWGGSDADDKQRSRQPALRALLDALAVRDIPMVGVLSDPPADLRKALFSDPAADVSAASLLAVPAAKLRPRLEAAIAPLALEIHDWQLGADTDRSLEGPQLPATAIRELRSGLATDGLPVRLAMPACLSPRGAAWGAGPTSCFIPSTTTPAEIARAFQGDHAARRSTWLTIEPPGHDSRAPHERVADFAQRLVIAANQVEQVFVHDPLAPEHGLLTADGSPGDLLLPWHTLASELSGAKLLGRLQLPGGSENSVWERDGKVSLVLWSNEPRTERLFAGRDARRLDLYRQVSGLPRDGGEQTVAVGPTPSFIIDADAGVLRTQLAVAVEPARLPSIPAQPQQIRVRVPNCFGRPIAGKVTLHLPDRWRVISPRSVAIDLPAGGEATLPFQVRLPLDGASGPQTVRVELEIAGEPPLRLTVYRQLQADGGDVELTATARLDEQGNLIVRQQLANRGAAAVAFACQLSIPGRRPLRITLRRLSPGTHEHVYTIPEGRELLGKQLRLRADELGGQRVLSQSLNNRE